MPPSPLDANQMWNRAPVSSTAQPPSPTTAAVRDGSNTNGSDKELIYDPKSGMSKEEFEWRRQCKMARQPIPQLLCELRTCSERMHRHFMDDPDAPATWVKYENDVHAALESNLKNAMALYMRLLN